MQIRALTPEDASTYREVRLNALREQPPAFGSPLSKEENLSLSTFADRLRESEDHYFLGAFDEEGLVGIMRFALFENSNEKHRGYVAGFYVKPEFRGQGIGRALLTELIARATNDPGLRRIHLSVVTEQSAAIRLYESMGFTRYATEREAFSANGQFYDEYLMELVLHEKAIDVK